MLLDEMFEEMFDCLINALAFVIHDDSILSLYDAHISWVRLTVLQLQRLSLQEPRPHMRSLHRHHVSESLEMNNNNNQNMADILHNVYPDTRGCSSSSASNVVTQGDELRRLKGSRSRTMQATSSPQYPSNILYV